MEVCVKMINYVFENLSHGIIKQIMNSSYDGLTYTNEKGVIVFNNKAYEEITGLNDILGKSIYDLEKMGYPISQMAISVFKTRKTLSRVIKYRKNMNKEVLVTIVPVYDENNIFRGIVGNVRDLTDLNKLRKELSIINAKYSMEKKKKEKINRELQIQKEKLNALIDSIEDLEFVGESIHSRRLTELAYRISNIDSTVLITGESGVGKDVFSRMVHKFNDEDQPFIKISCGAIPENLMESELFGYEAGAFTGSSKHGKKGIFELAEKGTIFLDEIGELTLPLQVKLLTVIQDRKFFRIGGTKEINMEARIIAATNRNLKEDVENGVFRGDLYYRLNVIPVYIHPLRARKKDIIPIANHILNKLNKKNKTNVRISFELQNVLENYAWPGNIRELNNIIERMYVFSSGELIGTENLPDELKKNADINNIIDNLNNKSNLKDVMESIEKKVIFNVLSSNRDVTLKEISNKLGINISTLVRKIEKYDLPRRYKK